MPDTKSPPAAHAEKPRQRLGGIVAAAVTPITEDFHVDVPRLVFHTRRLLDQGCDMVSLFGTTGEGPSFPVAERLHAIQAVIDAGIPAQQLVPAVMTASASEGREMFVALAQMNCRAALVMPPFFFQCDDNGVFDFCAHVAGSPGQMPLLLYHYPAMSGFAFGHALIARLLAHFGPRLAGIKDSSGDLDHTVGLIAAFPTLSVFTGTDLHLVGALAAGGAGIIGGVPNVNAPLLRARIGADGPLQQVLDAKIAKLFAEVVKTGGPMPIKAMVARNYHDDAWRAAAPPLAPLAAADDAALIACFEATGYATAT